MLRVVKRLSPLTAVATIEQAFLPWQCMVEVFKSKQRVRFRVLGQDGEPIFVFPGAALMEHIRIPSSLQLLINEARFAVEQGGFELRPWEMPPVKYREPQ